MSTGDVAAAADIDHKARKALKKAMKAEKKAMKAEKKALKTEKKSDKQDKKSDKKRSAEDDSAEKSSKKAHKASDGTWVYTQSDELSAVSSSEVKTFLDSNEVTLERVGNTDLKPIMKFKHIAFPGGLASGLTKFEKPTIIQSICWPPILSGQDLIGIAATGSGKTLAFGIPALIQVLNLRAQGKGAKKGSAPSVLVLSPTRELAIQIFDTFEEFGKPLGVKSLCIYGGVSKWEQKKALQDGIDIVVATPGRLVDLLSEGTSVCNLNNVSYFVLDEADRMLDLGFEVAIKEIVSHLKNSNKQTVMFSATWPTSIQKIAESYLKKDACHVTVGSTDLAANTSIEQRVEVLDTDPRTKTRKLMDLLRDYHKSRKNRILIFALYKKEAARLEEQVRRAGFKVMAIHGDLNQDQRSRAITAFRDGSCPLLIATDVAARGIDIPNVEYVINVTFPLTVEDYCHRIGRTGRAGKKGISHTFFTQHDKSHSGELINVLRQAEQPVPDELMKFGTTVKKKVDPNYGAFVKNIDPNAKSTKIVFDSDSDSD